MKVFRTKEEASYLTQSINDYFAFPTAQQDGMSLQDYFAALAMQALITKLGPFTHDTSSEDNTPGAREDVASPWEIARYAYEQANCMLEARMQSLLIEEEK